MDDFTTQTDSRSAAPTSPLPPTAGHGYTGVRGWLLVLCLMFTVIGPALSAWLMVNEYAMFAPRLMGSPGLQGAVFASLVITACAVAFGIYAGLRLWLIRPKAVTTAKQALLAGLAADIATTTIDIVAGPTPIADGQLLYQIEIGLVPSLVFFTLCFSYLNRSSRVDATYR